MNEKNERIHNLIVSGVKPLVAIQAVDTTDSIEAARQAITARETQHVKDGVVEIVGPDAELPSDEDIALYLHGWTPEATITRILEDYFGMRF